MNALFEKISMAIHSSQRVFVWNKSPICPSGNSSVLAYKFPFEKFVDPTLTPHHNFEWPFLGLGMGFSETVQHYSQGQICTENVSYLKNACKAFHSSKMSERKKSTPPTLLLFYKDLIGFWPAPPYGVSRDLLLSGHMELFLVTSLH